MKLRKGHVQQFAGVCVNSEARSLAEAFGRLPQPRATVYAYRLALCSPLRRRIMRLFAARRLVDARTRKARAAAEEICPGRARSEYRQ